MVNPRPLRNFTYESFGWDGGNISPVPSLNYSEDSSSSLPDSPDPKQKSSGHKDKFYGQQQEPFPQKKKI